MKIFLKVRARRLPPFRERESIKEYIVNVRKLGVIDVESRCIFIREEGTFELETAEFEKFAKALTESEDW